MINIFKCCFGSSKKRSKRDQSRNGDEKPTVEIDSEKRSHFERTTVCCTAPSHRLGDSVMKTEESHIHSTNDDNFQLEYDRWSISEDLVSIDIRMKPDRPNGERISDLMYVTGVMALYHTERLHIISLKSLGVRCMKRLEQLDPVAGNEIQNIMSSMHNLIRFHENIKKSIREAIEYDNQQPLVGQILLKHLIDGGGACLPSECLRILENRDRLLSLAEENKITIEIDEDDPSIKPMHSRAVPKDFVDTVISRINNYCVMVDEILRYTDDSEESKYLSMCIESIDDICLEMERREAKNEMRKQMSQLAIRLFNDSMPFANMPADDEKRSSHKPDKDWSNLEGKIPLKETLEHRHGRKTVLTEGPISCKLIMEDYLPIEKPDWDSCWASLHQSGLVFLCKPEPDKPTDIQETPTMLAEITRHLTSLLRIGSSDGYKVAEAFDDQTKRHVISLESISAGHQILLGFLNDTCYYRWFHELGNITEGLKEVSTNKNSISGCEEYRVKKKFRSPPNINLGSESFRLGQLPSCIRYNNNNLKIADSVDNDKPVVEYLSNLFLSESKGERGSLNSSEIINDTSINSNAQHFQDDCDGNTTVEIDIDKKRRSTETSDCFTATGHLPGDCIVGTEA